ncbi:MAG: NADH-quinone oxidoreductase subunit NuoF [Actinomycetota bacterium]
MPEAPTFAPPTDQSILLPFAGTRREIAEYEAHGGYGSLRKAVGMTGEQLVEEMISSNLRGRGGAGFPAGRKASFLAPGGERYLVINADESEPGTFKDREIILRNPHMLIEGVLIYLWMIRGTAAYIYIRGEYHKEAAILEGAIAQARAAGYVGSPLLGTDYVPEVYVHRGAGAYICGEETALLSSLNGDRGQPTAKPPFPAVSGAFKKPTLLNNVETVATVPVIIGMCGAAYAGIGTEQSTGTKMFSLSGHVRNPGNYEMPLSATYRDLIEGRGGGLPAGRSLKAFVPGGSSMPILMPNQLDTGLSFEAVVAAGSMAGSGAVIVVDDRTCMVRFALRTAEFYMHESCGKCTPCREGTRWITELLRKLEAGLGSSAEIDLLLDICDRVEGNCLCVLGDACAMPVRSHIRNFRAEFEEHCRLGRCPCPDDAPMSELYPPLLRAPLPMVAAT